MGACRLELPAEAECVFKSQLQSTLGRSRVKTIASKEISSITPCFDALSYLCEYLFELLELSRSIWFLFYQYAIQTPFISSVAINKD